MSVVFRARDTAAERVVALKILRTDTVGHQARLANEAWALHELEHPGIAAYVAHGRAASNQNYLAMEWVEGESLAQRLRRAPLRVEESIQLARRLAAALGYAHARGIIHRDVKPSNVMLPAGLVTGAKLIDFGLALGASSVRLTGNRDLVGSLAYMSPEQARGVPLDASSDVYSLGVLVYECVAGRPLVRGADQTAVFAKILLEEPARLGALRAGIPAGLEALVARMLAKSRAHRPHDCRDIERSLEAVVEVADAEPPARAPPSLTPREQRVLSIVLVRRDPRAETTMPVGALPSPDRTSAIRIAVETHGGRLDELADGSGLVTVAASSPAEDVVRAARCALAVRAASGGEIPVALVAGRCIVGGRLPAGEVVDRAIAILDTPGGGVRLDERTAALLPDRFRIVRDDHGLALDAELDVAEPERTLLGHPTPYVGRRVELASLEGAFTECAHDGAARAIVVTGPPGIGKSRLKNELLRRLRASGEPHETWVARGDPMHARSPLRLLADTVRAAARMQTGEPHAAAGEKLLDLVDRWVGPGDSERVREFLGELTGAPLETPGARLEAARRDPTLMGDQIRCAWEDLLAAACRAQPIVVVLDDVQWADPASLRCLHQTLRNLRDVPLLLLAFGRREAMGGSELERSFTELRLGPLTRRSADELALAVLGEALPAGARRELVDRAQGNPFFLEELLRAAAEGRPAELPDSVATMVQARLDRLVGSPGTELEFAL